MKKLILLIIIILSLASAINYDYCTNTASRYAQRADFVIATLIQNNLIAAKDIKISVSTYKPDDDPEAIKRFLVIRKFWPEKFIKYLIYCSGASYENALALLDIPVADVNAKVQQYGESLLAEEQKYLQQLPVMIPFTPYLLIDGKPFEKDFSFDELAVIIGKGKSNTEKKIEKDIKIDRPEIKNKLDIFVMADCPFGIDALKTVLPYRASINIETYYILEKISSNNNNIYSRYDSMHGNGEVEESLRQIAIKKLYPDKYWKYIELRQIKSTLWPNLFNKLGIDQQKIEKYIESKEFQNIVDKNISFVKELKISASPKFLWQNNIILANMQSLKQIKPFEKIEINNSSGSCGDK